MRKMKENQFLLRDAFSASVVCNMGVSRHFGMQRLGIVKKSL